MKRTFINIVVSLSTAGALLLSAPFAMAGRGSSRAAIQRAITSGSIDAIEAELERAEQLVCPACVDDVRALIDHPNEKVRRVAAWWLARRGIRQAVYRDMVARLSGQDAVAARNAADVLGELRMRGAIAPLGTALKNGGLSAEARAHAATAIGRIGHLDGQTQLHAGIQSADPAVRAASLAALRSLRGLTDVQMVLPQLSDADATVRSEAVYVLGHAKRPIGIAELMRMVQQDASADVRKRAAWALGEMGSAAASASAALSAAASSDPSPLVRSIAEVALAKLGR